MSTIQGTFGWTVDNPALIAGMRQSEAIATRGATNIQAKIAGLFKRDPEQRAENAIGRFIRSAAQGDIAGGIEGLTGAMSAFGLAAGVGIGAAIGLFIKFKGEIDATRKAHDALAEEINRRPLNIVTKLSDEGMAQALDRRQKLIADAAEKGKKTFGSELAEAGKSVLPFFFGGKKEEGRERMEQVEAENAAISENKDIMIARANLAMEMVRIEGMRLSGHEKEAAIAKIMLDAEQKRTALASSGITKEAFDIGDEAISRNAEQMIDAEQARAAIKERNLKIEERMADLIKKGLKPEDQKKVRAGLELQSLDEQIANEQDPAKKRGLLLQKTQKENELRGFEKPPGGENPFQPGTISAREFERSQESMKFNSQFASLGMTQEQKDLKGPASPNAEVVKALAEVKTTIEGTMAKYWGEGK